VFIKLHRINTHKNEHYLSEIVLNVSHVAYLTENRSLKTALLEGKLSIGLDKAAEFTDIVVNQNGVRETITVIGDVGLIESKMQKTTKKLLRD
jgi:hypothetical protein